MYRIKFFLMILLLPLCCSCYSQKQQQLNSTEEKCIKIFKNFHDFIKHDNMNNLDITSDSSLNYILLNYLFIDRKLDSTQNSQLGDNVFKKGELERFKRELLDYFRYFQEKSDTAFIDNIDIIPLRLSKDTFIYDRMTEFQKANTYVLYDKRNPEKILFYLLFIPPIKDYINEPRIWSWKLGYEYGKFIFTSPNGEEGYEHLFP